jgi:hypothetical protein
MHLVGSSSLPELVPAHRPKPSNPINPLPVAQVEPILKQAVWVVQRQLSRQMAAAEVVVHFPEPFHQIRPPLVVHVPIVPPS